MEVKLDKDDSLEYENHGFFRRILNFFLIPFLNVMPAGMQKYIKKTHISAREIIEHATTHRALENLYNKGNPHLSKNLTQKFFHKIWFNTGNAKAVRNRLKLVKRELVKILKNQINNLDINNKLKIVSIASGSARAVIEAIIDAGLAKESRIKIYFVDKSPYALEYSKELFIKNNIAADGVWINETASVFLKKSATQGEAFHIVEMVGLLDYFTTEKVTETLSEILKVLRDNGYLVTANILHNEEAPFVTNVVGWKMKYRQPEELIMLLEKSGFNRKHLEGYCEPLGIHCVAIAYK